MKLRARYYADLIGSPYEAGARGPDAYDCLGLALEVSRRLGHEFPEYLSDEATLHRELAADRSLLGQLTQVVEPLPGDIVLLRVGIGVHHLAVMLDRWSMLNTREGTKACVERLQSPLWSRRVVGFYRLPNITPAEDA